MTKVLGRIVTPNRPSAPNLPDLGELYFDTGANVLYWWNGTTWITTAGVPGPPGPQGPVGGLEVYEQPGQPVSTTTGAIWVDTDETMPIATRPFTYADLKGM